jgi:hypothetical protein
MGSKGLLITGVVTAIGLFLPWQNFSPDLGGLEGLGIDIPSVSISAMDRWLGVFTLILVLALLVWEGLLAGGVRVSLGTMKPAVLSAILGFVIAAFLLILFLVSLDGISWGAFLGLILALAMAYAAYMRLQESKLGAAPPPPAV